MVISLGELDFFEGRALPGPRSTDLIQGPNYGGSEESREFAARWSTEIHTGSGKG